MQDTTLKRWLERLGIGYLIVTVLTVVVAHIVAILRPGSELSQQLVTPLMKGVEFLDAHWKPVLAVVLAPVALPMARDLLSRLHKVGDVEFDTVPTESLGVHEKPAQPIPNSGGVER